MTIGPDPMTSTRADVLAPRHQAPVPRHQRDEAVEQVGGVVRSGRRLRVVLHRERRHVVADQPFDDVVVEADVAHRRPGRTACWRRPPSGASTANPWLCALISTRPVARSCTGWFDAAVPELQLVGAEAERAPEHLVAEADAEQRHARVEHRADQRDRVVGGRRVAGAVGHEDPVGADREQLVRGDRRRQHVHVGAALGQPARRHGLDAQVQRGDGAASLAQRRHDVRLRGRHLAR